MMIDNNATLTWALQILSGTPFRIFLLIILAISFIRWLIGRISWQQFAGSFLSLLLIALTPQLLYFFLKVLT